MDPSNFKTPRFTALFPSEGVGLDPITGLLPAVFAARQRPSCSENQGLSLISDTNEMHFRNRPRSSRQSENSQSVPASRSATDSKLCWEATAAKAHAPANSQTAGTEHMRATYERKRSPEQNKHQNKTDMGEGAGGWGWVGAPTADCNSPGSIAHWSATPSVTHWQRAHQPHSGKWK